MISAATRRRARPPARPPRRADAAGPWLYPEDQITDAPMRSLAAEITREKLFERLHDELPYQATVETDSWKDLPDGSARIEQTMFVTREGHRKIVHRRGRAHDQGDRHGGAQGHRRGARRERASLPARQGARELARRSRALSRDGARIPEGVGRRTLSREWSASAGRAAPRLSALIFDTGLTTNSAV